MLTIRGQFSAPARTKLLFVMACAAIGTLAVSTIDTNDATAKTPGSTYCFYGKCHRVKTLSEMHNLVGTESVMQASFYDSCSVDRYNPCGLTSSGEQFHPDRADNAASPIYPDGTTLLTWSPETKQAVVLRVNNAGPYWGARKLDVSRAAALRLGFKHKGVGKVVVRVLTAPSRQEATYRRNRSYEPVLGHIGTFETMDEAHQAVQSIRSVQTTIAALAAPVGSYKAVPGAPSLGRVPDAARPTVLADASSGPTTRPRLAVAGKASADRMTVAATAPVEEAKKGGHIRPIVVASADVKAPVAASAKVDKTEVPVANSESLKERKAMKRAQTRVAAKASKRPVIVAERRQAKTVRVAANAPNRARVPASPRRGLFTISQAETANDIISARFDRSIVTTTSPARRLPANVVAADKPKYKVATRQVGDRNGKKKYSSLSGASLKVSDARDVMVPVTPSLTGARPRLPVERDGAIRPRGIPAGPFTALA